jgi:hypothetical protein
VIFSAEGATDESLGWSVSKTPGTDQERTSAEGARSESVAPIPMPVITSTIVAVPVIAIVITVAPIRPVIPPVVGIPGIITVVGIGVVIVRSVEGWVWNRESKGKVNTGPRRRFREERQSSDRKNEDNELLHKKETKGMYHKFKKS